MRKQLIVALLVILSGAGIVRGQDPTTECTPLEKEDWTPALRKALFLEALAGGYATARLGPSFGKHFDYIPIDLRLGCRPFEDCGWLGAVTSVMIDGTIAPVTGDFGHILGGPSLLFRFDLCDRGNLVVPFLQVGTGFVLTDAYTDLTQHAIGESFEFIQQAKAGLSWRLNDNCSVVAEGGLVHVSNGGLAPCNLGTNNLGASIGLHWNFGGR